MFRGLILILQNNLDLVLAYILIMEREHSNELQSEVSIILEKAYVILSAGISSF